MGELPFTSNTPFLGGQAASEHIKSWATVPTLLMSCLGKYTCVPKIDACIDGGISDWVANAQIRERGPPLNKVLTYSCTNSFGNMEAMLSVVEAMQSKITSDKWQFYSSYLSVTKSFHTSGNFKVPTYLR